MSEIIAFLSDEHHAKSVVKRKTEEEDEPDLNETNYDEVRGLKSNHYIDDNVDLQYGQYCINISIKNPHDYGRNLVFFIQLPARMNDCGMPPDRGWSCKFIAFSVD